MNSSIGEPCATCEIAPIDSTRALACGDTATYCGVVMPGDGSTAYYWTITGGTFITSNTAPCVRVRAGEGQEFALTLTAMTNGCSTQCSKTVPISVYPSCEIVAVDPDRTLTCGDTASYCGVVSPNDGTIIYQWRIVGGTIETSPSASCIRVRAGSGTQLTLYLEAQRNLCSVVCEKTVVHAYPRCEIAPVDPSRALTCGDTASFCATVTPGGGAISYQWTITGGAITTTPIAACVRVQAGNGTDLTLRLQARRNNCITVCEINVRLGPMCQIVLIDSTRVPCADTTTFCADVTPSDGTITYEWMASGGAIIGPADISCVTVQARVDTAFALALTARRNGCPGQCEWTTDCRPTPVLVSRAETAVDHRSVRLRWFSGIALNATVERTAARADWMPVANITSDGTGYLTYEDRDIRAGERYGYRLSVLGQDGDAFLGEAWVTVPQGPMLSLEDIRPNPVREHSIVSFSLATGEPATLEVLDLGGRRVLSNTVVDPAPGRRVLYLTRNAVMASGLYWVRLTQGSIAVSRKICLIR